MSKLVGAGENLFRHLGDVHAVVVLHQLRVVQLGVLQGLNEDVTGGLCIVALVAENPKYPPLVVKEGVELTVWGVVVGKFKRMA